MVWYPRVDCLWSGILGKTALESSGKSAPALPRLDAVVVAVAVAALAHYSYVI